MAVQAPVKTGSRIRWGLPPLDIPLRAEKLSKENRTAGRAAEGVVGQTDELVVVLGVGTQPADAHGHAALGHPVQPGLGAVRLLKVVQELLGGRGQGQLLGTALGSPPRRL